MKRTDLKRGKPMKRSRLPRSRTPIKLRGRPRHAESGTRDHPYREHVRGLPCVVAVRHGHNRKCLGRVQPHHVRTRGAGGTDRQMVPMCAGHHDELHFMGRHSWAALHGLDLKAMAENLFRTYQGEHAP